MAKCVVCKKFIISGDKLVTVVGGQAHASCSPLPVAATSAAAASPPKDVASAKVVTTAAVTASVKAPAPENSTATPMGGNATSNSSSSSSSNAPSNISSSSSSNSSASSSAPAGPGSAPLLRTRSPGSLLSEGSFNDFFERDGEELGRGACFTVRPCIPTTEGEEKIRKVLVAGAPVPALVVKEFRKLTESEQQSVAREIAGHGAGWRHPHIVSCFAVFASHAREGDDGSPLYDADIVVERAFGVGGAMAPASEPTLLRYVKDAGKGHGLNEKVSRFIAAQLASALFHLHEQGAIHRDIKADNTLVFGVTETTSAGKVPRIKISDFATTRSVSTEVQIPEIRYLQAAAVAPPVVTPSPATAPPATAKEVSPQAKTVMKGGEFVGYQHYQGSVYYLAPELLAAAGKAFGSLSSSVWALLGTHAEETVSTTVMANYDAKVDTFAFGVLIFFLLTGRYPFEKVGDSKEEAHKIALIGPRLMGLAPSELSDDEKVSWGFLPKSTSVEGRDLLEKLIVYNPAERLSILEVLQHPWFHPIRDEVAEFFHDDLLQKKRV